jgi:hypothetical protein
VEATRSRRSKGLRRVAAAVLVLVVLAGVVAIVALAPGSYQTYPRTSLLTAAARRAAPAWTRPCWATARRLAETTCAHVAGRVVWIQHHDPDGDGDRHLIVIGRLHPRIVKVALTLPVSHLPGYGTRIDAVGYLYRGASGKMEVDAARLVPGGPTGR